MNFRPILGSSSLTVWLKSLRGDICPIPRLVEFLIGAWVCMATQRSVRCFPKRASNSDLHGSPMSEFEVLLSWIRNNRLLWSGRQITDCPLRISAVHANIYWLMASLLGLHYSVLWKWCVQMLVCVQRSFFCGTPSSVGWTLWRGTCSTCVGHMWLSPSICHLCQHTAQCHFCWRPW